MREDNKNEVISKDLMTIPNAISFTRILLITPFVAFFIKEMYVAAAITVGISGLSDLFDGMIARKFNQESELGKVLDPLADKLTLIAVGICLIFIEPYVLPLMIIMVAKDVFMIIGGTIVINQGVIPPKASWYGKVSTFVGRFIPGIRQLISIPAGLSKMHFGWFLFYTFLGAGLWNTVLAVLGYVAHGQADLINKYSHELSVAILILLGAVVLYYLIRWIIKSVKA